MVQPRSAARKASRRTQRRNRRVEDHRHLVSPIASHYAAHSPEPRDDLEQVGLLGLIRAAELFDSRQAVPFSAYARRHVRGAILHYLRDTAPLVRPSRRLQERHRQHRRIVQNLTLQLGRTPGAEDLRLALGLSREQWCRQEQRPWQERFWLEQQDRADRTTEQLVFRNELQGLLKELESLQSEQRHVVEAVVLQGQSLRTVACTMGSSAATVHRLLHRGLAQLRTRLMSPSDARGC